MNLLHVIILQQHCINQHVILIKQLLNYPRKNLKIGANNLFSSSYIQNKKGEPLKIADEEKSSEKTTTKTKKRSFSKNLLPYLIYSRLKKGNDSNDMCACAVHIFNYTATAPPTRASTEANESHFYYSTFHIERKTDSHLHSIGINKKFRAKKWHILFQPFSIYSRLTLAKSHKKRRNNFLVAFYFLLTSTQKPQHIIIHQHKYSSLPLSFKSLRFAFGCRVEVFCFGLIFCWFFVFNHNFLGHF